MKYYSLYKSTECGDSYSQSEDQFLHKLWEKKANHKVGYALSKQLLPTGIEVREAGWRESSAIAQHFVQNFDNKLDFLCLQMQKVNALQNEKKHHFSAKKTFPWWLSSLFKKFSTQIQNPLYKISQRTVATDPKGEDVYGFSKDYHMDNAKALS